MKKRVNYRKKTINVDTLSINAQQTVNAFGVHAPVKVDVTKTRRKPRN